MARSKDSEVWADAREALVDEPDFFRDILQATLQRLLEDEITNICRRIRTSAQGSGAGTATGRVVGS